MGTFVEWVLPGETVAPNKLRAMVTSFVLNPVPFACLISTAPDSSHLKASPFVDFALTAQNNIARMGRQDMYQLLRSFGAVPSGGMSAVLARREMLDACGWLCGCFTEGRPRLLAIYRALLSGPAVDELDEVGLLYHCYHGAVPEESVEMRAFQQIVWRDVLAQDGANLTAEQKDEARDQMRKNGIDLLTEALESGADVQRPVWQAYQRWLQAL